MDPFVPIQVFGVGKSNDAVSAVSFRAFVKPFVVLLVFFELTWGSKAFVTPGVIAIQSATWSWAVILRIVVGLAVGNDWLTKVGVFPSFDVGRAALAELVTGKRMKGPSPK